MCVIIDASVAGLVFAIPSRPEYAPVWQWIEEKDGVIVYGGQLAQELGKVREGARRLRSLSQAGKAHRVSPANLEREEATVRGLGARLGLRRLRKFNDRHVIALARLSGARVLCTDDGDLQDRFRNTGLVPRPKGRIYKRAEHKHLLHHDGNCPRNA